MNSHTQRYISKELIHLVGRSHLDNNNEQYETLKNILHDKLLKTHEKLNEFGNLKINVNEKISENKMYEGQVVCFCDIPTSELSIHTAKYGSFGLSFNKEYIIGKGGCPVLYIPQQSMVRSDLKEEFVPTSTTSCEQKRRQLSEKHNIDELYDHIDRATYYDQMMVKYHDLLGLSGEVDDDIHKIRQKMDVYGF